MSSARTSPISAPSAAAGILKPSSKLPTLEQLVARKGISAALPLLACTVACSKDESALEPGQCGFEADTSRIVLEDGERRADVLGVA